MFVALARMANFSLLTKLARRVVPKSLIAALAVVEEARFVRRAQLPTSCSLTRRAGVQPAKPMSAQLA